MGNNNIPVSLQPDPSGRAYVDQHVLELSSANDAGGTITFSAIGSGFVVIIPNADTLFDGAPKTLNLSISASASKPTPQIKDGLTPNSKDGWEYHVFCEDKRDWAHKPGASPPKIIIVD